MRLGLSIGTWLAIAALVASGTAASAAEMCAASRAELLGGRMPDLVDAATVRDREISANAPATNYTAFAPSGPGCIRSGRWFREGAFLPPITAMTSVSATAVCRNGVWEVSGH
ncbi:MAG: hypothetical protein KDJ16_16670 [Hyphomicrobiales bacterium]|nr:hypothetical protein [Hyphomicrobiales bacterium]